MRPYNNLIIFAHGRDSNDKGGEDQSGAMFKGGVE
jgi:hypothetical protein